MKIGLLGVGNIGATLARRLPTIGHDVKVANSRGPETIDPDVLSSGARAVTAAEAVRDVDVVILSIPLAKLTDIAELLADLPEQVVVLDTSNYYPGRDGEIPALESGTPESVWVTEQIGRPVVKAWNAVGAGVFADEARPAGDPDWIGLPIAGDDDRAKQVAAGLVDDSGFDAVDAGSLADSWRQQPGSPVYCTALPAAEIPAALAAAEKDRLPRRRDIAGSAAVERFDGGRTAIDGDFLTRLNRVLYM